MHGLGDNLHQRAVLRQLMVRHDVWLESSWVSPYHDLIGQGLKVLRKATSLRTQAKNAAREAELFASAPSPPSAQAVNVWYQPQEVRRRGSVLAAMCASVGVDYATADFRLSLPDAWLRRADELVASFATDKPILLYRPLVERTEWSGCAARNPHHDGYAAIFEAIRERFFVVSLADLVDRVEWIVGRPIEADATFHKGELDFEMLAALFARAAMVFCAPGFAVILAQAVGTPVICSFGRYERAYSFSAGARHSPYLGIEPINPCDDFKHDDSHDKTIDIASAISRAAVFAGEAEKRVRSACVV
ncbi:hypothetical protein ACE10Z_23620 [Bradyrhizobium sp. Pha-3]|uniref:hypothetical protein n=1 Tax=Bradyrhizobium sp. Pha-3 TaxID=208375 RepID=UPI0035D41F7E